MSKIEINSPVPELTLEGTNNITFSISNYVGKNLVIYFYPKDSTPGCTVEGQDFRDNYEEFKELNTEILGVSRDSIKSHENFKSKQSFPFELLSDPDEKVCKSFDVMQLKSMYGREYMGVDRSTFLVNAEGTIVKEWRSVKVKDHVKEVLGLPAKVMRSAAEVQKIQQEKQQQQIEQAELQQAQQVAESAGKIAPALKAGMFSE